MFFRKSIISGFTHFQGKNFLEKFPLDCCIPVYHAVSDEQLPHLQHIISYKNSKDFRKDLEFLAKNFQFLDWEDFKNLKTGNKKFKKKGCLLTFDDGLREFFDVVVPILEEMGIYAINFINPKFIDNQALMFRCKASILIEKINTHKILNPQIFEILPNKTTSKSALKNQILNINFHNRKSIDVLAEMLEVDFQSFLKSQKPYLSVEELKDLEKRGFGISNHGYDHPLYQELRLKEKLHNTLQAKYFLKKHEFKTDSFAFPFSDFGVGKDFFKELQTDQDIFCTFGSAGIKRDSVENHFQRIPMENRKSAEQNIKEEISYFQLKKIFNKNTIQRK